MKKLIFLFTMLLAVNFAMAQNTATTTQTGHDLKATTTQTGTVNTATTTQTGQYLKATTTQNGNGLVSSITQTNDPNQTGTPKDKEAEVSQSGDYHTAKITQNSQLSQQIRQKSLKAGMLMVHQQIKTQLRYLKAVMQTTIISNMHLLNRPVLKTLGKYPRIVEMKQPG